MSKTRVISGLLIVGMVWAQTPAQLQPPKDQELLFKLAGKGSQIYTCQNSAWVLKAPDAKLLDEKGELAGRHFAGPTWEAKDGSQAKGKMVVTVPSPEAGAVPWLLLTAVSHQGNGRMAGVQSVQRLETKGGKAPDGTCESGAGKRVAYEANYYFFGIR